MVPILGTAYLAPLRTLLGGEPPDFTTWVVGPSGHFKSEYAALALAHYGDFTRLTLPATFVATGNALERLCHALQDALLVVDDFFPAGDRRQHEAMNQTVSRLLRGIGNQAGRQRMRHDTSMRSDLPPRCLVLATGERLPQGHSTNARVFLVTIAAMAEAARQTWAQKLSDAQRQRHHLPLAMAGYLQWLAQHWQRWTREIPARFHTLRDAAYQAESHTREPSQVAYLQLAWDLFTAYAVDAGAIDQAERESILTATLKTLGTAASEHAQTLAEEKTVSRFLALITDGFASKQIYLRTPEDREPLLPTHWGWVEEMEFDRDTQKTVPKAHARQATLIGYLDDVYVYLLPEMTYSYLTQASQKSGRAWPVDSTTLLRELADADLIHTTKIPGKWVERVINKKIHGTAMRCIWLKREALEGPVPF
jgi:hypothetical protein